MTDDLVVRLREHFNRAEVKEVWLSLPTLFDRIEALEDEARTGHAIVADLRGYLKAKTGRIEALEQEIRWALNVPSTGDGAAAEAMRIILRRALQTPGDNNG